MERENLYGETDHIMMVTSKKERFKVTGLMFGLMVVSIKDNGKIMFQKDMELTIGQMGDFMKVTLKMI